MFERVPRQGIVVWVYNLKQIKLLRRYGMIYYVSKKMNYVYLYVNQVDANLIIVKLARLRFVRHVEISHKPELELNFGEKLAQKAENETEPLTESLPESTTSESLRV